MHQPRNSWEFLALCGVGVLNIVVAKVMLVVAKQTGRDSLLVSAAICSGIAVVMLGMALRRLLNE